MRLLLWLLLAYIGYKIIKGYLASPERPAPPKDPGTETHQDPVCGVYVSADDAVVGRYNDQRLYFCSLDCLEKYRAQVTAEQQHHLHQEES
jgi:YHS domain-containing protein